VEVRQRMELTSTNRPFGLTWCAAILDQGEVVRPEVLSDTDALSRFSEEGEVASRRRLVLLV
jgi:hypothetical protein